MASIIFSGCADNNTPDLLDEPIETFEVTQAITEPTETTVTETDESVQATDEQQPSEEQILLLDDKFAIIEFFMVSGFYSRNVTQDGLEFTEMFSLDKNNFVRIAENELEQEVFAYNYFSDDFTYIYYFDGDLMSKTIFNVNTGAILQDEEGYTESLKIDAEEIKIYFYALIESAGLTVEDL